MTLQQLLSPVRRAVDEYKMIKKGDKVAVGLSGGKDSVALLYALSGLKRFYPESFDLCAIHVDMGLKDADPKQKEGMADLCKQLGVEFKIEKTDIAEIVFDVRKESNPCSLCSKLRRGALNSVAIEMGCNKLALGHHADDLIETLFLSMFYEGRLSTFAPKSYLDKIDLTLIRPMIMIKEMDVISYSKKLPIVNSCCPANKQTKRELVKDFVKIIGKDIPNVRDMMFTALIHPERYNLFDKFESQIDLI
jgi:tRNA(Ile)-lysidine synthetase-like protein